MPFSHSPIGWCILVIDKILCDDNHISRYCKPSAVHGGVPMAAAFEIREGEDHLSVNWLECLRAPDLATAVDRVRRAFRSKDFQVKHQGRFAVLGVGVAKAAILEVVSNTPRVEHLPLYNDESHSGIFGYTAVDLEVAAEIVRRLDPTNIYSGTEP